MKKQNFIVISTLDWNSNWQIPHELVNSLLKNKNRILYVENTGVRSLMIKDLKRVCLRALNFLNSAKGFKNHSQNFSIFSPIILPYPYSKLAIYFNKYIYINNIKKWIEINKLNNTSLICFLPTPINLELTKYINFDKIIYYSLDNLGKGYSDSFKINKSEKKFLQISDANFFTSSSLLKKNYLSRKSFYLPAGVKLSNFTKKRKIKTVKKIIGYIGAVSDVFDQDLVAKIAKKLKNFEILIVGPVVTNVEKLKKEENIRFVNQVEHDHLQNYMIKFDIGIIPYKINLFTDSVYPCKLNEYLALGIPVVSTNLKELNKKQNFDPSIFSIAKNHIDFIQKIKKELFNDKKKKITLRRSYALKNSWDNRFEKFSIILNSINKKEYYNNLWTDTFINQINKFKRKTFYVFASLAFLYLFIFHSTALWHAGDYLRYYEKIEKSDTLVVFSGDGQDSYINNSYQARVLDAIDYYNQGFYNNIYLSSGREQTIPETVIIESLLKNNGFEDNQIIIQDKYPSNTAQNIMYIYESLKKNNINKTLFLTSPFHSRRSMMIWKQYNNDIEVIPIQPIKDNYSKQKYNLKLKSLKVIIYEYLSIIYNYFKGNIS